MNQIKYFDKTLYETLDIISESLEKGLNTTNNLIYEKLLSNKT